MPSRRVTYRDLRNTPSRVFERLANGEALELVAEGTTRAVLIPVDDDDPAAVLDAWKRGRALVALARLQATARRTGVASLTDADIETEIKATRKTQSNRRTGR